MLVLEGFVGLHVVVAAAAAKLLQSYLTLCDPIDGSPPGSPVPGILQARTLEWVAISFSYPWKWKVKVKLFSRVWLFMTPRTAAYQAPPSKGFSRQEYWSGLPLPLDPFNFSFFSITGWGIDLDYYDIKWFALEMNRDHSVIFEVAPKYCILDSCWLWGLLQWIWFILVSMDSI